MRPMVLTWIVPALLCYLGVSLATRAIFAFRRARRELCPLCGYAVNAAGVAPERCSECGASKRSWKWRCASSGRWLTTVIALALAMVTPLVVSAHPGRQTITVAVVLAMSALGLTLLLETRRARKRFTRRGVAIRVFAALVLQAPWLIIAVQLVRLAR